MSPRFKIDWMDVWKAVRGALVVAGALFAYLLLSGVDASQFGTFAPVAIPLLSSVLELLRRFLKDYSVQ